MNRHVILPWLLWLAFIIGTVYALAGCSTFSGTCIMKPVGMTDSGLAVVRTYCEAE